MSVEQKLAAKPKVENSENFIVNLQIAAYKEIQIIGLTMGFSGAILLFHYLPLTAYAYSLNYIIASMPIGGGIYAGGKLWEIYVNRINSRVNQDT